MFQHCHKEYNEFSSRYINSVKILHKPGPVRLITDWLSRYNHKENKDAEIHGMKMKVDTMQTTTNIPECMSIQTITTSNLTRQSFTMTKRVHLHRLARK